jgi:peroxiredoxin
MSSPGRAGSPAPEPNKRQHPLLQFLASLMIGGGLGLVLLIGLWFIQTLLQPKDSGGYAPTTELRVGAAAPDFELQTLSGETVSLKAVRGKPVMLNFWATWCAPCVLEMPRIRDVYLELAPGFVVLAINADEPQREVAQFVEDMRLTFPVLLDPGAQVQELYRLQGYPTSYFLDGQGVIRAVHIGQISAAQVRDYLRQLGVGQ